MIEIQLLVYFLIGICTASIPLFYRYLYEKLRYSNSLDIYVIASLIIWPLIALMTIVCIVLSIYEFICEKRWGK